MEFLWLINFVVNHFSRAFFIYLWRYIGSWPPWSCCGKARCYERMIKMLTTSGWWWTYNEEGDDDKDGNDGWMIIDLVSQHLQRNCPSRVSHSPSRLQFLGKISVNVLLFTSPSQNNFTNPWLGKFLWLCFWTGQILFGGFRGYPTALLKATLTPEKFHPHASHVSFFSFLVIPNYSFLMEFLGRHRIRARPSSQVQPL